jgi:hypothetical protein
MIDGEASVIWKKLLIPNSRQVRIAVIKHIVVANMNFHHTKTHGYEIFH